MKFGQLLLAGFDFLDVGVAFDDNDLRLFDYLGNLKHHLFSGFGLAPKHLRVWQVGVSLALVLKSSFLQLSPCDICGLQLRPIEFSKLTSFIFKGISIYMTLLFEIDL